MYRKNKPKKEIGAGKYIKTENTDIPGKKFLKLFISIPSKKYLIFVRTRFQSNLLARSSLETKCDDFSLLLMCNSIGTNYVESLIAFFLIVFFFNFIILLTVHVLIFFYCKNVKKNIYCIKLYN